MMNAQTAQMVNGMVIDKVAMMEGYLAMASINLEEANCCPYTYDEGMDLYKVK